MDAERALAASADVVTPVAVVDEPLVIANLARMQAIADERRVRLRPHAKTHKSPWVAALQMSAGAVGLSVATLKEAEVFSSARVDDLLVLHPIVGAPKLRRLAPLAEKARLCVALDSVDVARDLPSSVEVLWEVDSGQHRLGTPPGAATQSAVRELVGVIGPDRFRGLLTHGGHVYGAATADQRQAVAGQEIAAVEDTADQLERAGIQVREVSIGSTPTLASPEPWRRVSEIRPGTYVFGDANQVALGAMPLDDCALCVVATVVSAPEPGRAIADAGSKALSADLRVPGLDGFGIVLGRPDIRVERLSEEHCVFSSERDIALRPGDRVAIVPAHVCTTVNLHPALLVLQSDGARWEPVVARGWQA